MKELIFKMLTIIGYDGDMDVHANKLLMLIDRRILDYLVNSLPDEKKLLFVKQLNQFFGQDVTVTLQNIDSDAEFLQEFFSPETLRKTSEQAIETTLQEYLGEIVSDLSEQQKFQLRELFKIS